MVANVRITVQLISHFVVSVVHWKNIGDNEALKAVTATVLFPDTEFNNAYKLL
jgi:hypothetical protein